VSTIASLVSEGLTAWPSEAAKVMRPNPEATAGWMGLDMDQVIIVCHHSFVTALLLIA
jgi:hypothetical protein